MTNFLKGIKSLLQKRKHKSFRFTKKRDAVRKLNLPGYFKFNHSVFAFIFKNKKIFLLLSIVSSLSIFLLFGMTSQENYSSLVDLLTKSSGDFFSGIGGKLESAGLLFLVAVTGGISQDASESQQFYVILISIITWLSAIWLSRNIIAGKKVRLRDGLYSSGAPIVPMLCLAFVAFLQLLPTGIALFAYSSAAQTGLLNSGVEAMMFWMTAGLLVMLSIYWLTATLLAMIVITIPGVYPLKALKIANEIVFGSRIKIIMRLMWLSVTTFLTWVIVLLPLIIVDMTIRSFWPSISSIPLIPVAILMMSSATIIWFSVYIYLLYRKIVDDESK